MSSTEQSAHSRRLRGSYQNGQIIRGRRISAEELRNDTSRDYSKNPNREE